MQGCAPALTPAPSPHDDALARLRAVVEGATVNDLPDLLGRLETERMRGEARLRRLTAAPTGVPASEAVELLTLPQVAEVMGVPADYAYTLARQRKLPTVRLPGLDRGGRTTSGKYVRVQRAQLVAWLARHAEVTSADPVRVPRRRAHARQLGGGRA